MYLIINSNVIVLTNFTIFALITRQTLASVGVDAIDARGAVSAGIRPTLVLVDVASGSVPIGIADAFESRHLIHASAVQTRVGGAFIHVNLASDAGETPWTDAGVGIDAVHALRVVHARRVTTIVDVNLAILAGESGDAAADVAVGFVRAAAAIQTRLRFTLVQIGFAVDAGISGVTDAPIAVDLVQTLGVVAARIRVTFVDIDLAILAGISGFAGAGIIPGLVRAGAAVEARARGAVIAVGASAAETGIFVVRTIILLVLVPDTVGQLSLPSETSEVGGIDVDGTRALAEKIHATDLPSVVVAAEGLFQRSIAQLLANNFTHHVVELIVTDSAPSAFVVDLHSAFKGGFASHQTNRQTSRGGNIGGGNDNGPFGGGDLGGGFSIWSDDFSGRFGGLDSCFAFLFSENLSSGIGDVQVDDVDLGEGRIFGATFQTTSNDDSMTFHVIIADGVWDLYF